ncbi:MAG: hypothetical protein R3F14_17115 [Polyangiaceae bacterium]
MRSHGQLLGQSRPRRRRDLRQRHRSSSPSLTRAGNHVWTKNAGGNDNASPEHAADHKGDVIAGGGFTGTMTSAANVFVHDGKSNIFLAKWTAGAHPGKRTMRLRGGPADHRPRRRLCSATSSSAARWRSPSILQRRQFLGRLFIAVDQFGDPSG